MAISLRTQHPLTRDESDYLKQLCQRWNIPIIPQDAIPQNTIPHDTDDLNDPNHNSSFYLDYQNGVLQLVDHSPSAPGPLFVDFVHGSNGHRRLYGGGKNQLIAKAVGLNKGFKGHILDATAGLGRDAFVLAALGCSITLMERNPIIAALLDDGLKRGAENEETQGVIQHMHLLSGDSLAYLSPQQPDGKIADKTEFDMIYLDPMFPEKKGSARVKKEMQYLQQVVGKDRDSDQLLELAIKQCRYRVVVKRPKSAPYLNQQKPQLELNSKGQRLDIYIKAKLPI